MVPMLNEISLIRWIAMQRMTPLMVAASNGDAKIARLLVKYNADFQPRGPKACLLTQNSSCMHCCYLMNCEVLGNKDSDAIMYDAL